MLFRSFVAHDRLIFIAANDPVNTYELLSVVTTVIAHTSTIGVEATALGKPVIVASHCYYAELGFVWAATSRDTYFDLIRRSQAGELALTPAMRKNAYYCYYLTQVCNWVFTPFNPVNDAFWIKESIASLNVSPSVQTIVTALQENIPVALINHQNIFLASKSLAYINDDAG